MATSLLPQTTTPSSIGVASRLIERWIVRTDRLRNTFVFDYNFESGLKVTNNIQIAKLFRSSEVAEKVADLFGGQLFLVLIGAQGEVKLCVRRNPNDMVGL